MDLLRAHAAAELLEAEAAVGWALRLDALLHGVHATSLRQPALEWTLALANDRLGADHPHTLTTRNNLAALTGDAGDPAAARDLFAWETCMRMGTSWSWVPNEQYKSTDEIIRTLVSVVSRGGSVLLNVAPGPDGQLDSMAYVRLKEVGEWLKVNGEAVYGTKSMMAPGPSLSGTERVVRIRNVGSHATNQHEDYLFPTVSTGWVVEVPWRESKLPRVSVLGLNERIPSSWNAELLTIELPESVIPSKSVIKLTYRTHAIVCRIRF